MATSITRSSRAGISLLEVLISIGILAVGLTSVLSFIPAGHSMAKTSLVTDQAAIVAANALADLVTQGFLRVDSLSSVSSPAMIDPLGGPLVSGSWTALGFTPVTLRQNGVLASPALVSPPRATPSSAYSIRSRDDITLNVPDSDALDVTNRFVDGSRAYKGNFSWLASLSKSGGGPFAAGDEATLTIVVFHNRDGNQPVVFSGTYSPTPMPGNVNWSVPDQLIEGRKDRELIRTNGVCLAGSPPIFHRISMAAILDSGTGAMVDFDRAVGAGPLFVVPDAVAVIERTVTLEASSPYSE